VVVYKIDRLTRSLADFAKLVEVFDRNGVSFVSVTQQFNTTTSMGRLTLNILLSFAQFEREVTGERIRDKIAASKAKGMWMGGMPPLGYDVVERKLVVNAPRPSWCAASSVDMPSMVRRHSWCENLPSRATLRSPGSRRVVYIALADLSISNTCSLCLRNRIYLGEMVHKGESYPGQHQAIVLPNSGMPRTLSSNGGSKARVSIAPNTRHYWRGCCLHPMGSA